jgi:hypothetical protein
MNFCKRTNIPVLIIAVTAMVHFLSGTAFCNGIAEEAKKRLSPTEGKNRIMPAGGAFFKPSNPKALTGHLLECSSLPAGTLAVSAGIGAPSLPGNSVANNAMIAQSITPNTATFNQAALNIYSRLATAAHINQAIASSLPAVQNIALTVNIAPASTLNSGLPTQSNIAGTTSLNNSISAAIRNSSAIAANITHKNGISVTAGKDLSKTALPATAPTLTNASIAGNIAGTPIPAQISSVQKTPAADIQKTKSIAEAANPKRTFIQAGTTKNVSATKPLGAIFNIIRSKSAITSTSLKNLRISSNKTRKTAVNAAVRKQIAVITELKALLPLINVHKNTLRNNISDARIIAISKIKGTVSQLSYLPETVSLFIRNKILPIIRIIKDPQEIVFLPAADYEEIGLPYHALPMEQYPSDPAVNRITDTDSGSAGNCAIIISKTILNDILAHKALFSIHTQTIQAVNYSKTGLSPPAKNIKTSASRVLFPTLYPHAGNEAVHAFVFDRIAESFKTSNISYSSSYPRVSIFAVHRIFSLNTLPLFEHKQFSIRMGGFFCFNISGPQAPGSAKEVL